MGDTGAMGDIERAGDRAGEGTPRGLGLAIGLLNASYYSAFAWLIVFSLWLLISIYAIVKWAGSSPDDPNPYVIVIGAAGIVVLFTVLLAVGISLIGRAMNPKKKSKR
jgi:hypothetical protein